MSQPLLFPDPRPLDERLGRDFFLQAPACPGVYLMRDARDQILYVGKARNLRQRLNHYRLASPDRLPRRHLRLVNQVARIELQFCPTEAAALRREKQLIRDLKPKFNRAGVWPARPRFLAWRATPDHLEITVVETPTPGWQRIGPLGGGAIPLQRALLRLLWLALHPDRPVTRLPAGWLRGDFMNPGALPATAALPEALAALETYFWHDHAPCLQWLTARLTPRTHPFDRRLIATDLTTLQEFALQRKTSPQHRHQLTLL
jgi:predicted GIY-YIG superfamily endonuclease